MTVVIDKRNEYGDVRFQGFGRIGGRGHCVVYTQRGPVARLISFRKMHEKEMRRYE